ncbi:glycosyltransferase family 2 protein [Cyanobacteria bacterium FACHB-DQ100]|uniref:glycosyltransferase family A protein n=1 Tax=Leptolyngbya sp. DQ-M1 TaxID=2933920 RepID=UPI0019BF2C81|nr:glycosyltransferase family 2 protein [Cyanobacteria bacterium FACHB-DQ100]
MLIFIISLRSAKVSKSWHRVSKQLERTLRSVCNQTSPDFQVVVVCHERPVIQYEHPQINFVEVDFPTPDPAHMESKCADQHRKFWVGAQYAMQFSSSHIMAVDSDDCISKRLTAFVQQNKDCNGWFINRGYKYRDGSTLIQPLKNRFEQICGTCNIIRTDLIYAYLQTMKLDDIQDRYLLHHKDLPNIMKSRGFPLQPLPFPGAVYVTDNAENIQADTASALKGLSGSWRGSIKYRLLLLQGTIASRPLTRSVRQEFGLHRLSY